MTFDVLGCSLLGVDSAFVRVMELETFIDQTKKMRSDMPGSLF